ncbi:MAG: hypothetical protein LBD29_10775 [Treponema sp.]|nr:hypothetical protein [Treponema sp.]
MTAPHDEAAFFQDTFEAASALDSSVSYPTPKGGGLGLVSVARLTPQDFYFLPALFF